jgi:hypothetical protein
MQYTNTGIRMYFLEGFGLVRLPAHIAWAMWGRDKYFPNQKQKQYT